MRFWMSALIVLAAAGVVGCAGPAKLAEKSENKLAEGDVWEAWELATKALDKAPANARAKEAAASAASAISADWQRRITALANVDSTDAAEQVLEFVEFRTGAIPYTTVSVTDEWVVTESRLCDAAASVHYADGIAAMKSKRPKKAYAHFTDVERFAGDYRDAAMRANASFKQAQTRVAVVPLRSASTDRSLGRDVATAWNDALLENLPTDNSFTRMIPNEEVERDLRLSDLGRTSRADAVRLGMKAKADRVVWGTIGAVDSKSGVQFFTRNVWHRVSMTDESGRTVTRWVEVPIQVVARTRTVNVDLAYEVIAVKSGATLARESNPRNLQARAVWTAYVPDGASDTYALVTDELRRADPDHCKQIESEWASVVGAGTTLGQVIDAKRNRSRHTDDRAEVLARYAAGAAFVMLEELPSTEELARTALASGWKSVKSSLVELDAVDDVDLGAISASSTTE